MKRDGGATNWAHEVGIAEGPWSDTVQADYTLARPLTHQISGERLQEAFGLPETPPGLPVRKPPYGTLTVIDMQTGQHVWQRTVGDTPNVRDHPVLDGLNLEALGVSGASGSIVTKGGLVFVTGGGEVLHAFDEMSGDLPWQIDVGQAAYSVPMTYVVDGRQYVVVAVGPGEDAVLKAFSMPDA